MPQLGGRGGTDGRLAPRLGSTREGDIPADGPPILGPQLGNPCLRPMPGDALILVALGVGWTDRQTEMFNCRLFGYWLKALRNGGAFAVI